jgi:preprotein translocase subunit SecY
MAFRIFRILVGMALAGLAGWLVVVGAEPVLHPADASVAVPTNVLLQFAGSIIGALAILGIYYYSLWTPSSIHRILDNIFSVPELLKKIAFTLALLCIYRVGFHIALPGLDASMLKETMSQQESGTFGQAIAYFGMFTGGSLQQSTLFGLGIMPYISASIIFQLMTTVVPALEKLKKEGPAGYKKIQEYTRYATVPLCIVEGIIWVRVMVGQGFMDDNIRLMLMAVFGLTAGTMFLMWLGEQIDEYGVGNGISLLIMAGIVSRLPFAISELANMFQPQLMRSGNDSKIGIVEVVTLAGMFVFVVAGAILITQGQRRIPIQQAKQMRGRRVYGGQRNYLPLRVNHGGVMPLIFASSLMIFPNVVFGACAKQWPLAWGGFWVTLSNAFRSGSYIYELCFIGMIFFFAYFWTTVQFRPKEMAEQLQDYGSFIPGLRPGRRTADYLERVMERITYCGAAFLAVIAVIPNIVSSQLGIPFQVSAFLGGTGLLIVVSVALDLVQRIEANLVMRNYGGFLGGSTRIKGAYT